MTIGISIICCYNNEQVRRRCLDASVERYQGASVQYLPIDNREQRFTTAGAAFNYGVARADQEVVVFVQQDIYLHSIDRLLHIANYFGQENWGLLGANGPDATGASVGRVRDRVQLIGSNVSHPSEVESVDEILLMTSRDHAVSTKFCEDPRLAWHAYGVEYGLRLRRAGLRVGAINCALTHNSMSVNLSHLDLAHQTLAEMYPDLVPVRTTCGIARKQSWRHEVRRKFARIPAAVGRRLSESAQISQTIKLGLPGVLTDIRYDIDLLMADADEGLLILNYDAMGGFAEFDAQPLHLRRGDRNVEMRASSDLTEIKQWWEEDTARTTLVTGLRDIPLDPFTERINTQLVVGSHADEVWLLSTPTVPMTWSRLRSRPATRLRR